MGHEDMRVIGLAGWSGAGKTTLLTRLIPALVGGGPCGSRPEARPPCLRRRPARQGFLPAPRSRCLGGDRLVEPSLGADPRGRRRHGSDARATCCGVSRRCDLVIVEGFKREAHPKLEVFRDGERPSAPASGRSAHRRGRERPPISGSGRARRAARRDRGRRRRRHPPVGAHRSGPDEAGTPTVG